MRNEKWPKAEWGKGPMTKTEGAMGRAKDAKGDEGKARIGDGKHSTANIQRPTSKRDDSRGRLNTLKNASRVQSQEDVALRGAHGAVGPRRTRQAARPYRDKSFASQSNALRSGPGTCAPQNRGSFGFRGAFGGKLFLRAGVEPAAGVIRKSGYWLLD